MWAALLQVQILDSGSQSVLHQVRRPAPMLLKSRRLESGRSRLAPDGDSQERTRSHIGRDSITFCIGWRLRRSHSHSLSSRERIQAHGTDLRLDAAAWSRMSVAHHAACRLDGGRGGAASRLELLRALAIARSQYLGGNPQIRAFD